MCHFRRRTIKLLSEVRAGISHRAASLRDFRWKRVVRSRRLARTLRLGVCIPQPGAASRWARRSDSGGIAACSGLSGAEGGFLSLFRTGWRVSDRPDHTTVGRSRHTSAEVPATRDREGGIPLQLAKARTTAGGARAAAICVSASAGTLSSTWRCPFPQAGQRVGSMPVRRSIRSSQVSSSDESSLAGTSAWVSPASRLGTPSR